jgi:hypothetical protein
MTKGELIRKKILIEKTLTTKMIILECESIESAEYQALLTEIKFFANELLKLSLQFQEYQEALEDAQDESK